MSLEFQSMKNLHVVQPNQLPKCDALEKMLELQKSLNANVYPKVMNNIGIPSNKEDVPSLMTLECIKDKLSKEYLLAIIRECCEALDQLNSKAWKDTKKKIDVLELKFELIDSQFFLNSLYDIWDMTRDEVLGFYLAKHKENIRRHENGY